MIFTLQLESCLFVLSLSLIAGCASTAEPSNTPTDSGKTASGSSRDGGTDDDKTSGNGEDGGGGTKPGDDLVGSACATDADCDASMKLTCLSEIPPVPQAGFAGKTYPGGFCTRRCGEPKPDSTDPKERELSTNCGKGARCMKASQQTSRGGSITIEICTKACTAEIDCRTAEGYTCKSGSFGLKSCEPPQ